MCNRCASDLETLLASSNPFGPVKAFALPLFATIARISLTLFEVFTRDDDGGCSDFVGGKYASRLSATSD